MTEGEGGVVLQVLSWLAGFKPRQLAHATSVAGLTEQLCTLATEDHPLDTHTSDEEAAEDNPPPRLFAPQVCWML